jgi:hypothetical protein
MHAGVVCHPMLEAWIGEMAPLEYAPVVTFRHVNAEKGQQTSGRAAPILQSLFQRLALTCLTLPDPSQRWDLHPGPLARVFFAARLDQPKNGRRSRFQAGNRSRSRFRAFSSYV